MYSRCVIVVSSVGAVAAEGYDRTVRMRWTPPSDVSAPAVTSLTVYWCLAASSERGACAVSFHYPVCVILVSQTIMMLLTCSE